MADFGANNEEFRRGFMTLEYEIPGPETVPGCSGCRNRAGHGSANLSAFRRLASGIMRLADNKMSFRRKPARAAQVQERRVDLIGKAAGFSTEIEPR